MARLEDWYGPAEAARIRREHRTVRWPANASRGYGRFGDDAPVPIAAGPGRDALSSAMDKAISSLQIAIAAARAKVAVTPSLTTTALISMVIPGLGPLLASSSAPSDVQDAVSGGINQIENLVNIRLVGPKQDVLDGKLLPDKWFTAAQAIRDGLASILQELQDDSTLSLLDKNLSDTKQMANDAIDTLKKFGQQLPKIAAGLGITTLLIVGGLAFLLWPIAKNVLQAYATAPLRAAGIHGLAGYRRRRRRLRR